MHQVIHIHPEAPTKPALGAPCNGCGLCCLVAPCPLGMVLSGRRTGACDALRWQAETGVYRCGAITEPRAVLRLALPASLGVLAFVLSPLLGRLARRWIAAGVGCDSSLQVEAGVDTKDQAPRQTP
jgi:hypothetical protein